MMKQETCSTINGGGGAGAWVCEACERAPAAFLCRADSASLCAACDADVHSANPLASRHHRVPISGCLRDPSSVGAGPTDDDLFPDEDGDDDAASWLLLNPIKNDDHKLRSVDGTFIACGGGGGVVDEYLDLGEFNQFGDNEDEFNFDHKHQNYGMEFDDEKSCGGDSVVPVNQGRTYKEPMQPPVNFQLGMDYECSETGYDYSATFSHSVSSVTSLDVGVVPESTAMGAVSQCRSGKGTIDLFSGPPPMIQVAAAAQQLSGAEREARVLRYREKKKARKFEKTIRYASRKAYAESRPRIKGRFAKRNDAVHVSDHHRMFSAAAAAGVAPSF